LSGLSAGEFLEVVDQPLESGDFALDEEESDWFSSQHAIYQPLHNALDAAEGGAQLVGHVANELHPALFCPFQGLGHPIESPGQSTQFILTGHLDPLVVIASGNALTGFHHVLERANDTPGSKDTHGHRRQEGSQSRYDQNFADGGAKVFVQVGH
jgi:hypothetical protein